jgi:hypothetical protein
MLCGVSFIKCPVPAAGARIFRFLQRAVHATAGDCDGGVCTVVGPPGGKLRNATFSAGLGRRISSKHFNADRVNPADTGRLAAGSIRAVRRRTGHGESGDHEQRSSWNATVASGGGGCGRFHQPAGGRSDWGRGVWDSVGGKPRARYGFHDGDSRDLVGDDGRRCGRAGVGHCVKHDIGTGEQRTGEASARRTTLIRLYPPPTTRLQTRDQRCDKSRPARLM